MAVQWPWSKKDKLTETVRSETEILTEAKKLLEAQGYHVADMDPMLRSIFERLKGWNHSGGNNYNAYHVAAAFAAVYTRVAESRRKMMADVDAIRGFYLVDAILTMMADDALTPEIGTGRIVKITSDKPEIQEEINLLDELFGFDSIITSIAHDLLAYGEYTLSTKVNPIPRNIDKTNPENKNCLNEPSPSSQGGKEVYGLIQVNDNIEQGTVVAVTEYSDVKYYIVQDRSGAVHKHEPADYIKFSLSPQRLRIDLFREFNLTQDTLPEELADIPRYVRVGKSVIWPILSKLKELELLEALVPASKLSKLSNGTLIGVQVPATYDLGQGLEASQKVEGLLNKKLGVDNTRGEITIENILLSAGRYKCVPLFGDKGTLSKLDYQSDEPDELLSSVESTRKVITDSIGIPYEILFSSDGASKGEILKKYARYLRKLKTIRSGNENGLRQLIYIHLSNKGIPFKANDIKVEFYNKLIEIDNLDSLEFVDTTVSLLTNLKNFVLELADPNLSPFAERIHVEEFVRFLNDQMSVIGFNHLVDVDDDGEAEGGFEGEPAKLKRRYTTDDDDLPPTAYNKQDVTYDT